MTLQIEPPSARAGTDLERRRPAPLTTASSHRGRTQAGHPRRQLQAAGPAPTAARLQVEPLDTVAKRLYAAAGIGVVTAAAAAAALHLLGWPTGTKLGQLLTALLVLGATMFVGGGITGSARTRAQIGGAR